MKGGRKPRAQPSDAPVVLDCCGVDINDPTGNHVVNFTFTVTAKDDSETQFDGDIDLQIPHNLAKTQKPPKIEITHPETTWKTTLPVPIDDSFINCIREKHLIYKIIFNYRATTAHGKQPAKDKGKKAQDKVQAARVTNHTFFVDASCLLVRGGRFNPFMEYSSSCSPPDFSYFNFTVSIDHPLLSNAQIRRFAPFACMIKGVHQLPNSPTTFQELANTCTGPYLLIKLSETNKYYTIPGLYSSDLKLNTFFILWTGFPNTPSVEQFEIQLHDRDIEVPENTPCIGSGYLPPEPTHPSTRIDPLAVDQILGTKKETLTRPYGISTIKMESGRFMVPITPIKTKESLVIGGAYTEAGTYIVVEMEQLKDHIPQLSTPVPITPTKTAAKQPPHPGKHEETPKPIYFFQRFCYIARLSELNDMELDWLRNLEEKIVQINAKCLGQNDYATVPSVPIPNDDCQMLSGFIFLMDDAKIICLETRVECEAAEQLNEFNSHQIGKHILVLQDRNVKYHSPRLWGTFDCAVKKIKLSQPLKEILQDPSLYVQNSHLSNCFTVVTQLNSLLHIEDHTLTPDDGIPQTNPKTNSNTSNLDLYAHLNKSYASFNAITKSSTSINTINKSNANTNANTNVPKKKPKNLSIEQMYSTLDISDLWPTSASLDMLNAKKGMLLSMEELSFPPKKKLTIPQQMSLKNYPAQNEENPKESNELEYIPINHDFIVSPPHNYDYFQAQHEKYIQKLEKKHPKQRNIIACSSDGEFEIIIRTKTDQTTSIENPESSEINNYSNISSNNGTPNNTINVSNTTQNINSSNTTQNINVSNTSQNINNSNTSQNINNSNTSQNINISNPSQNISSSNTTQNINGSNTTQNLNGSNTTQNININNSNTTQSININNTTQNININNSNTTQSININNTQNVNKNTKKHQKKKEVTYEEWEELNPEQYHSLAESVGDGFGKVMRIDDGSEIRNGKRWYTYNSPKTMLTDINQLKANVNNEPWENGDNSMAAFQNRWMDQTRGPISGSFRAKCHPKETFNNETPNTVLDDYVPHVNPLHVKPTYITQGIKHKKIFNAVIAPIPKSDGFSPNDPHLVPISIEEPYQPPKDLVEIELPETENDKMKTRGKERKRFQTTFSEPVKKGTTDSLYVKKIVPTFPAPKSSL